jgi:hypothetical protein
MDGFRRLQQFGGATGILLGLAVLMNVGVFVLYLPTLGIRIEGNPAKSPASFVDLMVKARTLFFWTDLLFALAAASALTLVRALDQRLRPGSPVLGPLATVYGYLGIGMFLLITVTSLSLANVFGGAGISRTQMEQTVPVLLLVLFPTFGGAAKVLTGTWVFLASLAALRGGGLPRPAIYAGFLIGVLMAVQIVAIPGGETILAVWLIWVGAVLLMRPDAAVQPGRRRESVTSTA